jgi:hypothetical protein
MKTKLAATGGATQTFVDDVFSTYLYTGNGSTQTITNGIDLAGKGGLVWQKRRDLADDNFLSDTTNGLLNPPLLISNQTGGLNYQGAYSPVNQFLSTGFNMTSLSPNNASGRTFASWTFRKAAKFFDVVTYTGTGSARTIAHSLGVAAGMIIVKRTDTTGNWQVYHRSLTSAAYSIQLNLTNAEASAPTVWNSTAPTSSVFSVGTDATVNASGGTYVAYLYAHDTSSTGIIQCGGGTFDSNGGTSVTLGYEPQWVLFKESGGGANWFIFDNMRGFNATPSTSSRYLVANSSGAENNFGAVFAPNATGFTVGNVFDPNVTYIYMAIRMPNKPPTTGTQVFAPVLYTGDETTNKQIGSSVTTDMLIIANRDGVATNLVSYSHPLFDRMRGSDLMLRTSYNNAEDNNWRTYVNLDNQFGWDTGTGTSFQDYLNKSGATYVSYLFKRASGFFDVVCYTGAYSASVDQVVNHNLTVSPELLILKKRSGAGSWGVISTTLGLNRYLLLEATDASSNFQFISAVSSSTFSINKIADNYSETSSTYVAYLFATLAGIQYINSYVGDGTTGRVINCGFSAGARFICIKATSTTGSWWVWDSARGITSANDPALKLNSTAAEITSADAIDPSSSGFIVNQEATCSINASGVSYLVWAIA